MIKIFDLLRSLMWYIVNFIYELIDTLLTIIKKLNAFDIINSLSNNATFKSLYKGIMIISVTLFALFIIWRIINKFLDTDEGVSMKNIFVESMKCGALIMLSTFLFVQVSNFSIQLSNFTSNIFENGANLNMSDAMLTLFISYKDTYKNSNKFNETKSIEELVKDKSFKNDELYLDKFETKSRIILADEKDYKYEINWIMSILCGGFFLYSLFFSAIMLGRRQIEFLFLFVISPIVFSTSICNKQRRGAVIEQLVSLTLQSAVVILIVSLSIMIMKEVNDTVFFTNVFTNVIAKSLLYLGCATFILTGSQVINRFIGANISAINGREQMMSMIGYTNAIKTGVTASSIGSVGALSVGAGVASSVVGNVGGNKLLSGAGKLVSNYGNNIRNNTDNSTTKKVGNIVTKLGDKIQEKPFSKIGNTLRSDGYRKIERAFNSVTPYNMNYRNRRK